MTPTAGVETLTYASVVPGEALAMTVPTPSVEVPGTLIVWPILIKPVLLKVSHWYPDEAQYESPEVNPAIVWLTVTLPSNPSKVPTPAVVTVTLAEVVVRPAATTVPTASTPAAPEPITPPIKLPAGVKVSVPAVVPGTTTGTATTAEITTDLMIDGVPLPTAFMGMI